MSEKLEKKPLLDKIEERIIAAYLMHGAYGLVSHEEAINRAAEELNESPEIIRVRLLDVSRRMMEVALHKMRGEPIIVTCSRCNGSGKEQVGEGVQKDTCIDCKGWGRYEVEL